MLRIATLGINGRLLAMCASVAVVWSQHAMAQTSAATVPPPPPPEKGQPYKVDGKWINAPPVYPKAELDARIGGTVFLLVSVKERGVPVNVVVESSSHDRMLDQAAVDAAKGWHFKPQLSNGVAVGGVIRVPINFDPAPVPNN